MEDPGALSEAIDFLGDNPSQAEEMGRRGRRLAERHYNMLFRMGLNVSRASRFVTLAIRRASGSSVFIVTRQIWKE